MEKMQDLTALLKHEVEDLVSAEDQIIEALPLMIENAKNKQLKAALRDHLRVTKAQRKRLDKVQKQLGKIKEEESGGLFSRLFSSSHTCKGMKGIIEEGNKIMAENMTDEVKDAAIIASAQKVEHYEICGYGTARAYARELNLKEVQALLEETLKEEYDADQLLTQLAEADVNKKAEKAGKGKPGAKVAVKSANKKAAAAPAKKAKAAKR